jgi:nicotinamide-nucleotide amidase
MDLGQELKHLMLREPRWTLAAAESLTCGRVQAGIGAVSGASEFFLGGVTVYSLDQKVRHLGVDRAHAESVDCVSQQVAEEMARGASVLFGSDLAVATTGYAEPARSVAIPRAWWAVWHDLRDGRAAVRSGLVELPGAERVKVQTLVADVAVSALVDYLREMRG